MVPARRFARTRSLSLLTVRLSPAPPLRCAEQAIITAG